MIGATSVVNVGALWSCPRDACGPAAPEREVFARYTALVTTSAITRREVNLMTSLQVRLKPDTASRSTWIPFGSPDCTLYTNALACGLIFVSASGLATSATRASETHAGNRINDLLCGQTLSDQRRCCADADSRRRRLRET